MRSREGQWVTLQFLKPSVPVAASPQPRCLGSSLTFGLSGDFKMFLVSRNDTLFLTGKLNALLLDI